MKVINNFLQLGEVQGWTKTCYCK